MVSIKRHRKRIEAEIKAETKNFITQQFESPTKSFTQFVLSSIIEEEIGEAEIQQYTDTVKQALKEFFNKQLAQPTRPVVTEIDKPKRKRGNRIFRFEDEEDEFDSYLDCLGKYIEILFDHHGEQFIEKILKIVFPGQQVPYFSEDPNIFDRPWQIREDINIYGRGTFNPEMICRIIRILAERFRHDKPTIDGLTIEKLEQIKKTESKRRNSR